MIAERVSRFWCHPMFHPYLTRVLERLPEDVLQKEILDDPWFEIISIDPANIGKSMRLPHPAMHLIILSEAILESPDHEIIHTIVHEIGHKVARGGKSGLWEKEAEDLVKAWGFEEESKAVAYEAAILESQGYLVGFQWAARQKDLSSFKEFFGEWSRDALTTERRELLNERAQERGVLKDSSGVVPNELLLRLIFDDKGVFMTAVVYGVMSFLGEKTQRSGEEAQLINAGTMAETYCQCDWCGRDIKYGNASLTINRNIEQADWDSEYYGNRVNVIDAQVLITLCARCGGKLDYLAVPEALATCRYDLRKKPDDLPEEHDPGDSIPGQVVSQNPS